MSRRRPTSLVIIAIVLTLATLVQAAGAEAVRGPYALSIRPADGRVGPDPDAPANGPLAGRLIVIDPGHGGNDPGGSGRQGSVEKVLTLDMGIKLRDLLTAAGASVLMTRDDDSLVGLYERPALANLAGADANVSIHLNWYQSRWVRGIEVYYYPVNPASERLAGDVHRSLINGLRLADRGISAEQTFVAIRETTAPSVLIEVA
ncbi:MAG: N-acetylmuramoyl-L-alanine amidase family protein, partial [Bacillota bacterium]